MLARFHVEIPFKIVVPEIDQFYTKKTNKYGYTIEYWPPHHNPDKTYPDDPVSIIMDGKKARLCNVIRIDFFQEDFKRRVDDGSTPGQSLDPSFEILNFALNDFLIRLRRVTQNAQIHPVNILTCQWKLEYLNDDGSSLPTTDGKIKVTGGNTYDLSFIGLNTAIWDDTFSIPIESIQMTWIDLLLDAIDLLPQIGPSIVLANTALEVFIADTLDRLAKEKQIPDNFWNWITTERSFTKRPTTEEEYTHVLRMLTGHSLSDDTKLWINFKDLREARNKFVHKGIASLHTNPSESISEAKARELIQVAWEIPLKIREWIPEPLQWKMSKKYDIKINSAWPPFVKGNSTELIHFHQKIE